MAEDDSEWYECDDGLDIEWGLVAADVRVGPGSDCPDCEKCGHVDECGLSSGDRESHDMLMVPSGDVSECLAVGGVDRGTMSGLVALVVASCAAAGDVCTDVAHGAGRCILAAALKGKALRKHLVEGHRPYSDRCPWCVRANLRERKAVRKVRDSKVNPNGYTVDSDFSGKHEPDIDGFVYAYIGVEIESGYGFVALQYSRSATDTLVSIRAFECQLKRVSGDTRVGIVHHHHDDDKSFRGVVGEYAVERGWIDTHTGGYRPNANSVVERRIGMLNQVFRCLLLVATGGHLYYEQLWGPGLVHANDIVNDRPWPDRDSPSAALSGKPSVRTRLEAVFGEYCLYKIAKEQKSGKWQPNAEMGIWLGYSSDVVNGHRIAPIKWNKDSQCWDIGAVVTASTVRLYPDVFPLRMGPDRADELGSAGFETFVECVFEPLLVGGGLGAVVDSGGADADGSY